MTEKGLVQRLAPRVLSRASPPIDWLLQARADIQQDPEIQELFHQARREARPLEWLRDNLAIRLGGRWDLEHFVEAQEVAQYLADEFAQLGEGIQVVSQETGQVEALLSEGDLYQPDLVEREDGSLALPLPRVRPEIVAGLLSLNSEKAREKRVLQVLSDKLGPQSGSRLLVATRRGRSIIVEGLTHHKPQALLEAAEGTSAAFLRHFALQTGPYDPERFHVATARTRIAIQDQTTTNLLFDRSASLRGVLVQGWVRDIARQLSVGAHESGWVSRILVDDLEPSDLEGIPFWIAPPDTVSILQRMLPQAKVLPVEGACLTGFPSDTTGTLTVTDSFGAESHEFYDRWEVVGNLPYLTQVNLCPLRTISIVGIPSETQLV